MALIRPNPLLEELRGKLGDLYFARCGDHYSMRKRPHRHPAEASEAQKPTRQKLAESNLYWRQVQSSPEAKAVYVLEAKARRKRACDVARADFGNAPVVTDLDLTGYSGAPGGVIRIQAVDDFEVRNVTVRLLALDEILIEEGEATLDRNSGYWLYAVKTAVPPSTAIRVEVTGKDRPGNTDVKRVDHVCGLQSQ